MLSDFCFNLIFSFTSPFILSSREIQRQYQRLNCVIMLLKYLLHGNGCRALICDSRCGAITVVISFIKRICPSVGEQ